MLKLKGRGDRSGRDVTFVMLGLSDLNLEKLKQHNPIVIFKEELQIEHDIFIFWGADEEAMIAKLQEEGFPVDQAQVLPATKQ